MSAASAAILPICLLFLSNIFMTFAWYAHFFVEGNKPATFGHPFYSLVADYRMLFLMMAGRMDEQVALHAGATQTTP